MATPESFASLYTTTREISAIWLAESRCILALIWNTVPTCKNYSYYGNPKSPKLIILWRKLRKNGGKISRFWNQEIQELKENSENQNTEKSTSTWLNVWTSWAKNKNFKTNLLAFEAKQLDENKHMA